MSEKAMLQRFLNGRFVSFDIDRLLTAFDPFHCGIVDVIGTVPLRFPGYETQYELRLGADAIGGVVLGLHLSLPIHAPGFWFCIHCLMREDFVALISPSLGGVYYGNKLTPEHLPDFMNENRAELSYVETARELIVISRNNSDRHH